MKTRQMTLKQHNAFMKNKQRGALSAELAMVVVIVVLALIFIVSQAPNIMYKINEMRFVSQTNEIAQETLLWKKARPNYEGVTIAKVCADGSLNKNICGASNDGKATNPFGGDWTIAANTRSKGLFDITATIPDATDAERIPSMAGSVAPSTRGNCADATDCPTLTTTANSLKMTF
ncbi:hypothetical protein [Vibrio jasicida]|uniref:hypothetical protein n=1 Tax=Vibrio jasicida TaxID=766224 RepID=UPI0005EDCDBE|nr:hypothetical protein [Vibrio jasicida]